MFQQVVPGRIRRSYLLKFSLAIVLVIGLIGVVGAVTYAETVDQLESDAEDDLTAVAELGAVDLDRWLGEREAQLLDTTDDDVYQTTSDFIRNHLEDAAASDDAPPELVDYHYVDIEGGTVVASSNPSLEEGDQFDRNWGGQQPDDGTFVSPIYVAEGEQRIDLARTVIGSNALVMELNFSAFAAEMTQPTDGAFSTVVNHDGQIMGSDRSEFVGEQYGETLRSQVDYDGASTGFLADQQFEFGGDTEYLLAYATLPDQGMTVVVNVPTSEAYALSGDIAQNLLLLVGVAVFGLGLLGLTLVRGTVRDLDALTSKVETLESGDLDVDLASSRVDEIGQLYDGFAGMRDSLRERIEQAESAVEEAKKAREEAETARSDAEKARERAQETNRQLEERAREYRNVMEACADGDLTRRLDPDTENEAMREIATAFNEMIANIERTVAAVSTFATDVEQASETVTDATESVAREGQETSESVTEIATAANDQNRQLRDAAEEMERMSASIEEVTASANEVASTSQQAAKRGDEGRDAAAAAVEELHAIEERSRSAAHAVGQLDDEMEEIDAIVETISEIADRVNMLALNASIEAARAGEAGSGFAVVAEEVKTLAEETQQSAGEVEELITSLRSQTDETVSEMTAIQESVVDGVETVEAAETALETIAERVEQANDGIQEMSEAMDAQSRSVQGVADTVDDVAAISQETARSASSVSETTQEQAITLSEVTEQTQDLNSQARQLREMADDFTVDVEGTDDQ